MAVQTGERLVAEETGPRPAWQSTVAHTARRGRTPTVVGLIKMRLAGIDEDHSGSVPNHISPLVLEARGLTRILCGRFPRSRLIVDFSAVKQSE